MRRITEALLLALLAAPVLGQSENIPIAADADDGTQEAASTSWNVTGFGEYQDYCGNYSGYESVGLRWSIPNIESDDTIDTAIIRVIAGPASAVAPQDECDIHGESSVGGAAWSTSGSNLPENISVVATSVTWDEDTDWTDGATEDSPDIATVLADMQQNAGWTTPPNVYRFALRGNTTGPNRFIAFSDYAHGTDNPPELRITYTVSGGARRIMVISDGSVVTVQPGERRLLAVAASPGWPWCDVPADGEHDCRLHRNRYRIVGPDCAGGATGREQRSCIDDGHFIVRW